MQNRLSVPRGSTHFSDSFARFKPREVQADSYLKTVYSSSAELVPAVRSIASRPAVEVINRMGRDARTPSEILFDHSAKLDDIGSLRRISESFERGRNARIAYYMVEPYFDRFFHQPYQGVCSFIANPHTSVPEKEVRLAVLGAFGNLLPEAEKAELGKFLAVFMKNTGNAELKAQAMLSLAMLHSKEGIPAIREAASGIGEKPGFEGFDVLAHKAELILLNANPSAGRLEGELTQFLMGSYTFRVKMDTAALMRSMNSIEMTNTMLSYLEDVEGTIKYLNAAFAPSAGGVLAKVLSKGSFSFAESALVLAMETMPGSGVVDDIAAYLSLAPTVMRPISALSC